MSTSATQTRPPVVAIMGHVDHGKSTLLDYIRKSNIVAGEAGGITQHIAAYEVEHPNENGDPKKITFIDTPGHAAFTGMRECGASAADIAILIISAEDSVKAQTEEAIKTITQNKVPFIVAINKIDKPNANIEKVKSDLLEHNVYVEGFGGDTPWVAISAKSGQGVEDLLETILLLAEMEEFTGKPEQLAEGFVIESHLDAKRGVSATLVIKNGSLSSGQYIVAGSAIAKTRMVEDFLGNALTSATFSAPITIIGFDSLPQAGERFQVFANKKEAEVAAKEYAEHHANTFSADVVGESEAAIIPLVLKADTAGTLDAVRGEIKKLCNEDVILKIIKAGIGDVNESDLHLAVSDENSIIIGFQVGVDTKVRDSNDAQSVTIKTFDIIYKLTEWLEDEREVRRPRKIVERITGAAKVLKVFSVNKEKQVIGCKVKDGMLSIGDRITIMRRENAIGSGEIKSIEQAKAKVDKVKEGEFGMMVEAKHEIAPGDILKASITEEV